MLFLTWQLWRGIRFPMWHHPVFRYARRSNIRSKSHQSKNFRGRLLQVVFVMTVIMLAVTLPQMVLPVIAGVVLGLPIIMILFNGTLLGIIWVTEISSFIGSRQRNLMFDLMHLTPLTRIGAVWLFALGVIYRHDWLRRVHRIVRWSMLLIVTLLMLAMIALLVGIAMTNNTYLQQQQLNVLRDCLTLTVLALIFWLDHVQSIVIATGLSFVLPIMIRDRVVLKFFAPIVYLFLQTSTYATTFITYIVSQAILMTFSGETFITYLIGLAGTGLMFFLLREGVLGGLLFVVRRHHDVSVEELQTIITPTT